VPSPEPDAPPVIVSQGESLWACQGYSGDPEEASGLLEDCLAVAREIGDRQAEARALSALAQRLGDPETRRTLALEALEVRRQTAGPRMTGWALWGVGRAEQDLGNRGEALRYYTEALASFRAGHDKYGIATALQFAAPMALVEGDFDTAQSCWREALTRFRDMGHRDLTVDMIEGLGRVARHRGEAERAVRLCGAARALRDRLEAAGEARPKPSRPWRDEMTADLRARLSQEAFDAAWAEGEAMTLDQAIHYALEEGDSP